MKTDEPRFSLRSMVIAVVLTAIACTIVLVASNHGARSASIQPAASTASRFNPTPITAIRLRAGVRPTSVREGEKVRIAAQVSVAGGPGPVTFSARIPQSGGGTYEGSVTTMIAQNATHGFDLPGIPMNLDPGDYTFTFRAFSGRVASRTQVAHLTVLPAMPLLP